MNRTDRQRMRIPGWRHGALLCALLAAAGAARAEITFQTRQDVSVGTAPTAVTLLPGSPPTLLVANHDGLSMFRYQDGDLDPGARSLDGRGAQMLVYGALAPGGAPALAFAGRESARVSVAPLDARGAIGNAEVIELPALPRAARVASLGNGLPSALFVGHDAGISVLTRSDGGWQRRELAAPRFGRDFEIGDLDGDGRADLVVADEGTSQLSVLRGTGDGGFAGGEPIDTARGLKRLLLADLNGDQRLDVLVIGDSGLAVHTVQPDGSLTPPQVVFPDAQLVDAAAADANGDGRIDLALLDRGRNILTILLSDNQGRLLVGDSYSVGHGAETALMADLDGDGRVDALTLNRLGDNATLLPGRGGGVFDGIIALRSEIGDLTAVAVDDFDRDDFPDLVVASEDGGRVALFLGGQTGRFRPVPPLAVGRQPRALVTSDFNRDEFPDLAVANFGGDSVAILAGDGHGGFAPSRIITVGTGPSAIGVGSFGADTSNDLAIVNSLSDSVSVLYSDGRGEFPTVTTFPVSSRPSFLIIGDTNSDGHQDLVVGSQFSESVAILLGDGRQLAAPTTNKLKGVARPSLAEDFDRDGRMDLVNIDAASGAIEILPGTGDNEFGSPIRLFVGRDPHAAATGDFDRDGRIDIAVLHRATRTVAILLNRSKPPSGRHGQRAGAISGPSFS